MAANPWKAPSEIVELLSQVKEKHHGERLANASVAVSMEDTGAFVKNKLNLGKLSKFSPLAKLWQGQQHDFCLSIPMELWQTVLKRDVEREAYLDLQLTRCTFEYLPEEIEENGKKQKVKDDLGRIVYSKEPKVDEEGNIKWKIAPLDLEVFGANVRRYGLWYSELADLKDAIAAAPICIPEEEPLAGDA